MNIGNITVYICDPASTNGYCKNLVNLQGCVLLREYLAGCRNSNPRRRNRGMTYEPLTYTHHH